MNHPMLSVRDIRKSYGDLKAVDGVSFELKRGELFGLLGPNGAGKTTLLSIIVGALKPDSGDALIETKLNPADHGARQRIGAAPQALALYDELTAEENLRFFGGLYSISGKALTERVKYGLDFSGLHERRNDRVKTFSGGMKRRLNLACSLIHNPPVLLLDEPTVGVDPQSRNLIFDRIEELKREGRTIIYTTHYMEEAHRLCDRVAVIDHGKILDIGTVDELVSRHGGDALVEAKFADHKAVQTPSNGQWDDDTLRVMTSDPFGVVANLSSAGSQLISLKIDRPDLETVFLNLTGRSLRD